MKKLTALLLALVMVFSLAACGGSKAPATAPEATEAPAADAPAAESTEGYVIDEDVIDPINGWDEYDQLIEAIRTETDLAKRAEMMHQAEDLLMETGALLPLYFYTDIYMQKDYLTDVYWTPFGYKYFMFAQLNNEAAGADNSTLRLYLASEPDKLDPALNSTVDGAILAINTFSGLMTYDAEQKQVYDLAESHTLSEDGLTYTFTLKDGLKWSNGDKLDANDFVYSWNRAADPKTGSDYGYMFAPIKGYDEMTELDEAGNLKNPDAKLAVSASDDGKTLTVELSSPCAYFMDLAAFPTYMPVHQASVEAADPDGTNPGAWATEAGFVSNGAYTLKEWKHNSTMIYEKNPNYHNADKVVIERQEYMLSSDENASYAAYNAGNLDFIDGVPTAEIPNEKSNPEFKIIPTLGTYYVTFNVTSPLFEGMTPGEAATLRKALALIIDRDYIVTNIGQAEQVPAGSFIPAGCQDGNGNEFKNKDYYDPSYEALDANIEQAREMLKALGYEFDEDGKICGDKKLSFTYLVNTPGSNVDVAVSIQQDMAELGIDMQIKDMEWNVFLNDRKNGNFDVARNGWLMDYNDAMNMLEMWTSTSGNNDAQFGGKR